MVIEPCKYCNKYHTGIMCGVEQTETVGGTYYSISDVKSVTKKWVSIEKYEKIKAENKRLKELLKQFQSAPDPIVAHRRDKVGE